MKKFLLIPILLFCGLLKAQEQKITTSDGVDLYVKVKGEGTPLLYLHGGPGSGSFWFEKFFGDFMEENFTVVYLDQRGVGRSTSPADGNYSMERLTKDFEEVRETLGFETWLTLGHSFGGLLQMGYAESFPEAINGMIMVNCTLNIEESFCESWGPKAAELLGENFTPCDQDSLTIIEKVMALGSKLREKDLFWQMAYEHQESEAIMNDTYKGFENWNYDFSNAAMTMTDYRKDFKPATSGIDIPVLFFYGSRDWMVGPNHHEDLEFPELMLWKNEGGHLPFQENKEDLSEAILAYKAAYRF